VVNKDNKICGCDQAIVAIIEHGNAIQIVYPHVEWSETLSDKYEI
jgi:hypothetical protein